MRLFARLSHGGCVSSFSLIKRNKIYSKTNGRCNYCAIDLRTDTFVKSASFVVDHIYPVFYGGDNSIENLVPSCRDCNNIKRAGTLEEFRVAYCRLRVLKYPHFTDDQKKFLLLRGIDIDREIAEAAKEFKFFFEKEAL